ncbi:MAG: hypothetical protein JW709_14030 [Sedimentisphaerales bacterium]|nr:hypothetical protein [Sedimentisphaerales bacterium]
MMPDRTPLQRKFPVKPVSLDVFHLYLPFKRPFGHATAIREGTDTVVIRLTLEDGTTGWGEGLPREYVTGETVDCVIESIENVLLERLRGFSPRSFGDVLELADSLPFTDENDNVINCARCAVELTLLDAYSRYFHYGLEGLAGWLGSAVLAGGPVRPIRVSGVLGSNPERVDRQLRMMRLFGLRDFKLKLGTEHDEQLLDIVVGRLERALEAERVSLRADANGAWDIDAAVAMSEELAGYGFCCLEQPLAADDRGHLQAMADLTHIPLMADESLITLDDAEVLAQCDLIDHFNIRISKNGGLLASMRMAEIAMTYGRGFQLGAMVGETAILAAAGRLFLQLVRGTSFTEICYGRWLLAEDIVDRSFRFGYGGRLPKITGWGLGIEVNPAHVARLCRTSPRHLPLA